MTDAVLAADEVRLLNLRREIQRHPSQAGKLLHRLERDGLIGTERGTRAPNAWCLTSRGEAVLSGLPEGIYE